MAGMGALVANIVTTFDPKGINNAKRSLLGLTDASVSSSKKQKIAMGLIGGAFAAAGVAAGAFAVKIGRDGVRAALEDQKSLTALNKTLTNLGYGATTESVEKFIKSLQFSTGVSDDELRPALSRLVVATGDLTKAQQLLTLSQDISAGTGKDLESVTSALSKAALGQTTALSRLGVGIDKTTLASGDLDKITDALGKKFEGQAAAAADTFAGKLAILNQGVNEAQESIGYALLNSVESVSDAMGYGAGGLAEQVALAGESVSQIIIGISDLTVRFLTFIGVTEDAASATDDLETAQVGLFDKILAGIPILGTYLLALKGIGAEALKRDPSLGFTLEDQRKLAAQAEATAAAAREQAKEEQQAAKAKAKAEKDAADALRKQEQAAENLLRQQERLTKSSAEFAKFVAGTSPTTVQGSLDAASLALNDMRNSFSGVKTITEESVDKFDDLTNVIKDRFSNALSDAQNQLEDAKQAFNDFKSSISNTITGTINFASAIEETDFLTGLQAQAAKAIKFSERINTLLTLGLSERGLQEVLNAGTDAGTAIADQIIAGGSTVVVKVNELLNSVSTVADQVGQQGASMFYSAGVAQGQSLVDGIKASIIAAGAEIANLSASLVGAGAVLPPAPPAPPAPSTGTSGTPSAGKGTKSLLTTSQFAKASNILKTSGTAAGSYTALAFALSNKTIKMARGGIVMGPTNALIGEAGPEAVIPLSGSNSGGLGTTINITVNAGIGTSGSQVGREIVDAIKKYERTSGPVFASA
jgi:hypothetical protein